MQDKYIKVKNELKELIKYRDSLSKPTCPEQETNLSFVEHQIKDKQLFIDFYKTAMKHAAIVERLQDEMIEEIKEVYVDCPECKYIEDDQYQCTTCGCQGGNIQINAYKYIMEGDD